MLSKLHRTFLVASCVLIGVVAACGWINVLFSGVAISTVKEVERIEFLQVQAQRAAVLASQGRLPQTENERRIANFSLNELSAFFSVQRQHHFQPPGQIAEWIYRLEASAARDDAYKDLDSRLKLLIRNTADLAAADNDIDREFTASSILAQARSDLSVDLGNLVAWHSDVLRTAVRFGRMIQIAAVPLVILTIAALWFWLIKPLRMQELETRRKLEQSDREARKLALVAEHANDAVTLIDLNGRIEWVNAAHDRNCHDCNYGLVGMDFRDIHHRRELTSNDACLKDLDEAFRSGDPVFVELENASKNGDSFWTELELIPVSVDDDTVSQFITIERNITERKRSHEQLQQANAEASYRALHDSLTDLPNRQHLSEHLAVLLAQGIKAPRFGVLHVDLDRFKQINDSLGHAAGDHVLKHVSRKMRSALRDDDFLARVGGDEFIVVAQIRHGAEDLEAIGARIVECVRVPTTFQGKECQVGASVGYAIHKRQNDTAEALIAAANIALYEAKRDGRGLVRMHTKAMGEAHEERQILLDDLKSAVKNQEFEPYFQPQIHLGTGALIGVELLARWNRPHKGVATPAVFLDLANEAGMISDIDEIVLSKGMQALVGLRASGLWIPRMSINASARSLREPGFVDVLKLKLDKHDLKPEDMAIEVLEETLIVDAEDIAAQNARKLFQAGFAVEMDDFGAGYASMANLASLKLSTVKLDKSLIAPLHEPAGQAIVRAIVSLCQELNIEVLAEGLETAEQAAILRQLDCNRAQGFWIGRPMPSADLHEWVRMREQQGNPPLSVAS